MNRTPPIDVIRELRKEVGFGCPVPRCGNPYLEWHHFDPPWHVENHHRPEGMIALCNLHHKFADNGAYPNDQLKQFKENRVNSKALKGNFEWRRKKILAVVGRSFYYETPYPLVIDGYKIVSLSRDENGYLLLNIQMLSLENEDRLVMHQNCWESIGKPKDFECRPSGKKIKANYPNGDMIEIIFSEIKNTQAFKKKFKLEPQKSYEFPLTVVEIYFEIANTGIKYSPKGSKFQTNDFSTTIFDNCMYGLILNPGLDWKQKPNFSKISLPTPTPRQQELQNYLTKYFGINFR